MLDPSSEPEEERLPITSAVDLPGDFQPSPPPLMDVGWTETHGEALVLGREHALVPLESSLSDVKAAEGSVSAAEVVTSSPHQSRSFFLMCEQDHDDAEAAARRFLKLLSLHSEGVLLVTQLEPYGDISLHRGPKWHDWEAQVKETQSAETGW